MPAREEESDPYAGSVAAHRLAERIGRGQAPRLACLDIDSTLTGNGELADAVRRLLDQQGYEVAFVTSRTEEMIMTSAVYRLTAASMPHFRAPPHLGGVDGQRWYIPPEEYLPAGVLDGDLIAGSTGTRLWIRREDGGYRLDTRYADRAGVAPATWRRAALTLIEALRRNGYPAETAAIERWDEYIAGQTDISPPEYRIQLNFAGVQEKLAFVSGLREVSSLDPRLGRIARNIRLTDDSDPDTDGYKVFLTPRRLSKAHAATRMVDGLSDVLDLAPWQFRVLFAGDSFPDLKMGLLGAPGADATLLLVGGSRLTNSLVGEIGVFAGEPLRAIRGRLIPVGGPGRYQWRIPGATRSKRELILGDLAYPGTSAVETVYRYLLEQEARIGEAGDPGGRTERA